MSAEEEATGCGCYRTRFPFEPRDTPWAELCLCVKRQVRVRLLPPLATEAANKEEDDDEEWCVAQLEDGEVGLLPRFLLEPAPSDTFRLRDQASAERERAVANEGSVNADLDNAQVVMRRVGEIEAECEWLRQTAATLRHELAEREADKDDVSVSSSSSNSETVHHLQEEIAMAKQHDIPALDTLRAELERCIALNEQGQAVEEDPALAACAVREAKLQAREAKVGSLLAEWQVESDALAVSEAALEPYLQPPPSAQTSEVTVVLREDVDWPPRTLAGLTPQEEDELNAAVKAYDKYSARLQALGEQRRQAARGLEQMHEALRRGDAEVAKMMDELHAAEDYIALNTPLLAELQTQHDIAHRLLQERE